MLTCKHLYGVLRLQFSTAHLQVESDILVALEEAAQQANRHVLVLQLSADAAELGADVEDQ